MIKYFSMFSGIGGFERGIQKSKYGDKSICIGRSEIDKFADTIYRRRFPSENIQGIETHKNYGDATEIRTEDLPNFDLLVGGFPCQSFSIGGRQEGFNDTRGTLFFEIARVLQDKEPKYFLLENVKNLLSHDGGRTFKTIIRILAEVGYDISWEVYNSKNFGVPQNRERVFIKGYFREKCGREILYSTRKDSEVEFQGRLGSWDMEINEYVGSMQKRATHTYGDIAPCLTSMGATNVPIIKYNDDRKINKVGKVHKHQRGDIIDSDGLINSLTYCDYKDPLKVYHNAKVRKLTPLECERLQGFDDGWTEFGVDGKQISDSRRYMVLGNAVTVPVITYIFNNWNLIGE